MGLALKFNLILVFTLAIGFTGLAYTTKNRLLDNAREEVIERAGLMMEGASAVRKYTVEEIRPLLKMQTKRVFLPQTVPAYAATQSFLKLHETHPNYIYKEATLNPTNPRDRAVDWEADIVMVFRNQPDKLQMIGTREASGGTSLYLARPLRIKNPACLACHSTAAKAPATMIERYGDDNGFGWQLNEVVGAQIVSVPMDLAVEKAQQIFNQFIVMLGAVFFTIFILFNMLLYISIIRPVRHISKIADEVSKGNMDAEEFDDTGKDELAVLAHSFNRMRRSMEKAFSMLEGKG